MFKVNCWTKQDAQIKRRAVIITQNRNMEGQFWNAIAKNKQWRYNKAEGLLPYHHHPSLQSWNKDYNVIAQQCTLTYHGVLVDRRRTMHAAQTSIWWMWALKRAERVGLVHVYTSQACSSEKGGCTCCSKPHCVGTRWLAITCHAVHDTGAGVPAR